MLRPFLLQFHALTGFHNTFSPHHHPPLPFSFSLRCWSVTATFNSSSGCYSARGPMWPAGETARRQQARLFIQAELCPRHHTSHLYLSSGGSCSPSPQCGKSWPKNLEPLSFRSRLLSFCQNASTTISWEIKGKWYNELQEAKLDFTRLSRDRGNLEVKYNMIDSDVPEIILVRIKADSEIYLCTTKNNFFLRAKI